MKQEKQTKPLKGPKLNNKNETNLTTKNGQNITRVNNHKIIVIMMIK